MRNIRQLFTVFNPYLNDVRNRMKKHMMKRQIMTKSFRQSIKLFNACVYIFMPSKDFFNPFVVSMTIFAMIKMIIEAETLIINSFFIRFQQLYKPSTYNFNVWVPSTGESSMCPHDVTRFDF